MSICPIWRERLKKGLCTAVCLVLAFGVVGGGLAADAAEVAGSGLITIEDSATPLSGSKVLKPVASGETTFKSGSGVIDVSNANEGYIMAKYSGSAPRVKLRITRSGKTTYTYDLSTKGGYEVFPLTSGDGRYSIEMYENVSGTSYAKGASGSVDVKLRNSMLPFLYPSQQCNFNKDSEAVKKSNSLSQGAADQVTIVSNVYNYVISNIKYDNALANDISKGKVKVYLPKVDKTLSSGKGICYDYASLMTAMLRAQGIPTRMEVGYVSGGAYHAWLSTYIKDVGWVNGVIQFDGKSWKLMDPTFASSGGSKYVGQGSNYKTSYFY